MLDERTMIEKVNIINPEDFVLDCAILSQAGYGPDLEIASNYSLLNTKVELLCNVSGVKTTFVITIGDSETDVVINDNSYIKSISYNDSSKLLNITCELYFTGAESTSAKVIQSNHKETKITDIKTKIDEIEAILKNHYDALILLLEKHDLVADK